MARPGSRRGAVVVCTLVLAAACSTAHAVGPISLSPGQITDQVGALGSAKSQVQSAIDQLYNAKRIDLHVAYVKDFSGQSPTTWADETATRNGMGVNDVLLAVATSARQYAFSVENSFPISASAMDQVASVAVEPSLRNGQWAAAAIGATQGLAQAASGKAVTSPTFDAAVTTSSSSASSSSSSGSVFWVVLGFLALATVAVVGFLLYSRRRAAAQPTGSGEMLGQPTVKELEEQAARMLVDTDDAIRTSEQELGFAIAQFGQESAAGFSTALDTAKQELGEAFRLRARLDGDTPVAETERYQALRLIVEKCSRANAALDAQTAAFEQLRDLQHRAPEVLAQLDGLLASAPSLIQTSNSALGAASARFSPQALEPVAQNPEQARQLVTFATAAIAQAKSELAADRQGQAAVATRSAQEALGQVGQLTTAVDRRLADLEQARTGLAAIIAEVDGEIVQGRGLLEGADATAVNRLGGLEQEAAAIKSEVNSGHGDPLDQLGRLQAVDARLDELLLGLQTEHERRVGAQAMLEQALLAARSDVAAAQDFITTRRGAIGSQARTLQAEAERRLSTAMSLRATDPTAALEAARQASSYARSAQQQATADLNGFGGGTGGRSASGGGMAGGALGGLFGAVLGGIATEAMRSGGGRSSRAGPTVRQPGGFQGAPGGGRRSTGGRF